MQEIVGGLIRLILVMAWLSMPAQVWAERVKLQMGRDITALAEYRAGQPGKPVVVILHGFLQTCEFPIVFRMTEGLAGLGYTVLAPTLTLGVTHRRTSLACEAIHTHTLDDGIDELQRWMNWLRQRHQGPIVLVGHSLGSIAMLAYLERNLAPRPIHFIGVSIMEGRIERSNSSDRQIIDKLRASIKQGRHAPVKQSFSFCKSFQATPESLLSYLSWSPERIRQTSARHKEAVTYIMGSRDDRLGPGWIESLTRTGVRVRMIEGANHFMDGEHEFDLLDMLDDELKALRQP